MEFLCGKGAVGSCVLGRKLDAPARASGDAIVVDRRAEDHAEHAIVRSHGGGREALAHVVDDLLDIERSDLRELPCPEHGEEMRAQHRLVAAPGRRGLVVGDSPVPLHPPGEGDLTALGVLPRSAAQVGLDTG